MTDEEMVRAMIAPHLDDNDGSMIVTEWVLVAHRAGFDGSDDTGQVILLMSGGPPHRHRGLLADACKQFDSE